MLTGVQTVFPVHQFPKFQVENKSRDLNENLNNSLPFDVQAVVSIYDLREPSNLSFDYFDETDHD